MIDRAEFEQYFSGFNPDEITAVADRWFNTPTYIQIPQEDYERARALMELTGDVKTFTEHTTNVANELAKAGRELESRDFIDQRLIEAEVAFEGDELLTARRYALYRRGYVQEHLATFGVYSKLPVGNRIKTLCFLNAARDYMLSDLELGCVTDYGLRVAECFGGTGNQEMEMMVLRKCIGGDIMIINKKSSGMIMVQDLKRRATETIDVGEVPGGGDVKIIRGKDQNTQLN